MEIQVKKILIPECIAPVVNIETIGRCMRYNFAFCKSLRDLKIKGCFNILHGLLVRNKSRNKDKIKQPLVPLATPLMEQTESHPRWRRHGWGSVLAPDR